MHAPTILPVLTAVILSATVAAAQSYSIPWHTINGGGGSSTGGGFSLSGTIGQWDAGQQLLEGDGFSLTGGFWSFVEEEASVEPVTIFDNTSGFSNSHQAASTNAWLAGKLCIGSEAFLLDSVTLFLHSGDGTGKPHESTVRLRIYSHDPVSGRPSADIGPTLDLSGTSNPVTLAAGNVSTPFKWIPATPFSLSANQCYWIVLSVESGRIAYQWVSTAAPTGAAGTLGRSYSVNGGSSWVPTDGSSNYRMLITGTASQLPPSLTISLAGAGEATISWPFPSTGFALQQSVGLNPSNWNPPSESVSDDGTNRFLLVDPGAGNRFFRLLKHAP